MAIFLNFVVKTALIWLILGGFFCVFSQSESICNSHSCYKFALVSQKNCTSFSANQDWVIFLCISLITQCRWLCFTIRYLNAFRSFNLQILMTGNSFHQQFAKQTSLVALTSDLFEAWYPGLWNKCHWVHGSFWGNPRDLHTGQTRSKPIMALENTSSNFNTILVFRNNNLETESDFLK